MGNSVFKALDTEDNTNNKMKNNYLWLDYSQKDIWKEYLLKLPKEKRDVYYDPDYVNLYVKDTGKANCYVYIDEDSIYIYPFLVHPVPEIEGYFDISAPYGYSGPVSNTDNPDFLNKALKCFNEEALKRNMVAEVVKFHPLSNNHIPLTNIFKGNIIKMCSTVYVEMNVDEETRWMNIYTHANRKNIKKAKRSNIEVNIGQSDKLWEDFRSLYASTMTANKTEEFYYFSEDYFNKIKQNLVDSYVLFACKLYGKNIAIMLVLIGTTYAYCHLTGTDREFMSTGVNNLLHHELILWCKEKGYSRLLIGGGRSNSDDDSLLRYKKNFSDKLSSFYVGEYIFNPEIYNQLCEKWSLENPDKQVSEKLLKYRT